MLIGGRRQFMTPAQTSALKNRAPISRSHAFTETVHAHAATDLRLIRTFCHSSFLTSKIIAVRCLSLVSITTKFLKSICRLKFKVQAQLIRRHFVKTSRVLYRNGFDSVNLDSQRAHAQALPVSGIRRPLFQFLRPVPHGIYRISQEFRKFFCPLRAGNCNNLIVFLQGAISAREGHYSVADNRGDHAMLSQI